MIEIRNCTDDELTLFFRTLATAFGDEIPASEVERIRNVLPLDRTFAAFEGDRLVGSSGSFPFQMTVPGASVAASGVTMVGVLPSHRRKGVMSRMMRALIDDAHARDEPVAILWASEEAIYQRFGYGLTSNQGRIDIERHKTRFLGNPEPVGTIRMIDLEQARDVLPAIYDAVLPTRPGMVARSADWWRHETLADPERSRGGGSPKFCCVFSDEGRDRGYAIYRTAGDWADDGTPDSYLNVREAVAVDPVAYREVWRFLFGVDLVDRIKAWFLPADLPLALMLEDPRRLRFAKSESLWLRIVDVAAALEARSYAADGEISFALTDMYCPWNEGEWTLRVSGGRGDVTRGDGAELSLDVSALAAAYLGGFTFAELERALRVEGRTEGAVARADAMFRTDIAPWCVESF
ncbi:MAG: GNAT family N-acetyltransferase [Actinomycetota bacterium]|nr:GNAT family N-acetyltransferase [Actinomycetota bacterium]